MKRILIISDNEIIKDRFFNTDPFLKNTPHYFKIVSSTGQFTVDLSELDQITDIINNFDLVISFHCTQIFPKELYENIRCINIHPGFNPHNRGYFPHVHSIINGLPAGVTIHEINGTIDGGDIIYQEKIEVESWEISSDVYKRIIDVEWTMFKIHINDIISGNYEISPAGIGNYNSKYDFTELCELNINKKDTLKNHLNLLRALTHESYNNAYFIDDDGTKVYVKISFEK